MAVTPITEPDPQDLAAPVTPTLTEPDPADIASAPITTPSTITEPDPADLAEPPKSVTPINYGIPLVSPAVRPPLELARTAPTIGQAQAEMQARMPSPHPAQIQHVETAPDKFIGISTHLKTLPVALKHFAAAEIGSPIGLPDKLAEEIRKHPHVTDAALSMSNPLASSFAPMFRRFLSTDYAQRRYVAKIIDDSLPEWTKEVNAAQAKGIPEPWKDPAGFVDASINQAIANLPNMGAAMVSQVIPVAGHLVGIRSMADQEAYSFAQTAEAAGFKDADFVRKYAAKYGLVSAPVEYSEQLLNIAMAGMGKAVGRTAIKKTREQLLRELADTPFYKMLLHKVVGTVGEGAEEVVQGKAQQMIMEEMASDWKAKTGQDIDIGKFQGMQQFLGGAGVALVMSAAGLPVDVAHRGLAQEQVKAINDAKIRRAVATTEQKRVAQTEAEIAKTATGFEESGLPKDIARRAAEANTAEEMDQVISEHQATTLGTAIDEAKTPEDRTKATEDAKAFLASTDAANEAVQALRKRVEAPKEESHAGTVESPVAGDGSETPGTPTPVAEGSPEGLRQSAGTPASVEKPVQTFETQQPPKVTPQEKASEVPQKPAASRTEERQPPGSQLRQNAPEQGPAEASNPQQPGVLKSGAPAPTAKWTRNTSTEAAESYGKEIGGNQQEITLLQGQRDEFNRLSEEARNASEAATTPQGRLSSLQDAADHAHMAHLYDVAAQEAGKAAQPPVTPATPSVSQEAPAQGPAVEAGKAAPAGQPAKNVEQTDESGAKYVPRTRKDGSQTKKYVATKNGLRVGDKYDTGMSVKVVTFEEDTGPTAPRGDDSDVEYVETVMGPDEIVVGRRRATNAELDARRERLARDAADDEAYASKEKPAVSQKTPETAPTAEPVAKPATAKPEAVQEPDAQPSAPPGPRWKADRGTMPGEPMLYLDGDTEDTAKAAITEEVDDRTHRALYRATRPDGTTIALTSTEKEAADAAEKEFPLAESANPQPTGREPTVPASGVTRQTYPATAEMNVSTGNNPFPQDTGENVPEAVSVPKQQLDDDQIAKITGNKSAALQHRHVRGIYAALSKWSDVVADMFYGAGAVTDYLFRAGVSKDKKIISEYNPLRAIQVRQLSGPNYKRVAELARKQADRVNGMMDAAANAVKNQDDAQKAVDAFGAWINAQEKPAGITEERWSDLKNSTTRRFVASLTEKQNMTDRAKWDSFARLNAASLWSDATVYDHLEADQDLSKVAIRARTIDASMQRLKSPTLKDEQRRYIVDQIRSLSATPAVPRFKDTPEAAAFGIVNQNLLGGNDALTINATPEGNLQRMFTMVSVGSDGHVSSMEKAGTAALSTHNATAGAEIHQADSWPLMGQLAQEHGSKLGLILDPSYFTEGQKQGEKAKGTKNYEVATNIETAQDLLGIVDTYVLPAWKAGSRIALTNTWSDWIVRELRSRGFNVLAFEVGSAKKPRREFIAWNFNTETGEVFPPRTKAWPKEIQTSPKRSEEPYNPWKGKEKTPYRKILQQFNKQKIVDQAVRTFGITDNPDHAFFILDDGRYLKGDSSDHFEVVNETDLLDQFMHGGVTAFQDLTGAMRVWPLSRSGTFGDAAIEIHKPLTEAQERSLAVMLSRNKGYATVDVIIEDMNKPVRIEPDGEMVYDNPEVKSMWMGEYGKGTNPARILLDIRDAFQADELGMPMPRSKRLVRPQRGGIETSPSRSTIDSVVRLSPIPTAPDLKGGERDYLAVVTERLRDEMAEHKGNTAIGRRLRELNKAWFTDSRIGHDQWIRAFRAGNEFLDLPEDDADALEEVARRLNKELDNTVGIAEREPETDEDIEAASIAHTEREYADLAHDRVTRMESVGADTLNDPKLKDELSAIGSSPEVPYRVSDRMKAYRTADGTWHISMDGRPWRNLRPRVKGEKALIDELDARQKGIGEQEMPFSPSRGNVTSEQDARYLELAKDPEGNRAELQRMVDEAAKKAGINWSGVVSLLDGKIEEQFPIEDARAADFHHSLLVSQSGQQRVDDGESAYFWIDAKTGEPQALEALPRHIVAAIKKQFGNSRKSADPVTYDDKGNVIPLSQRFNAESPDIRFSPSRLAADLSDLNRRGFQVSENKTVAESPEFKAAQEAIAPLGIRLVPVTGLHANAAALPSNDRVMLVNTTGNDFPLLHNVGHEAFEVFKLRFDNSKSTPEENPYLRLTEVLRGLIVDYPAAEAKWKKWLGNRYASREKIEKEMMADLMGENFQEPKFWKAVWESDRSLFEKLVRIVKAIIDRILQIGKGQQWSTKKHFNDLELARKELAKIYVAMTKGDFESDSQDLASQETSKAETSPRRESGWFSRLENAVNAIKQEKMSADQLDAATKQNVDAEEREWTGLNDFIAEAKAAKRSVTKAEVLALLEANRVQVKDVVKGGALSVSRLMSGRWGVFDGENQVGESYARQDEARANAEKGTGATAFSAYQLPGGTNYREVLLTLPSRDINARVREFALKNGINNIQEAYARYAETEQGQYPSASSDDFRSSHFSEPNIVAHLRVNDRTSADGRKMLFIEEAQSDWHKKGRDEGYRNPQPDVVASTRMRADGFWEALDKNGNNVWTESFKGQAKNAIDAERQAREWVTQPSGNIPDAPFKGDRWVKLALRRAILMAVQEGKDSIGWTTGQQQAERYDLSKQVKHIAWEKNDDGTYNINAPLPNGEPGIYKEDLSLPEVKELVGKDVAKQIEEGKGRPIKRDGYREWTAIEGEDLKVGGTGMRGFYDQTVPSIANEIGKKYGARASTIEMPVVVRTVSEAMRDVEDFNPDDFEIDPNTEEVKDLRDNKERTVHVLPITPAMREAVQETGMPLFSPRRSDVDSMGEGIYDTPAEGQTQHKFNTFVMDDERIEKGLRSVIGKRFYDEKAQESSLAKGRELLQKAANVDGAMGMVQDRGSDYTLDERLAAGLILHQQLASAVSETTLDMDSREGAAQVLHRLSRWSDETNLEYGRAININKVFRDALDSVSGMAGAVRDSLKAVADAAYEKPSVKPVVDALLETAEEELKSVEKQAEALPSDADIQKLLAKIQDQDQYIASLLNRRNYALKKAMSPFLSSSNIRESGAYKKVFDPLVERKNALAEKYGTSAIETSPIRTPEGLNAETYSDVVEMLSGYISEGTVDNVELRKQMAEKFPQLEPYLVVEAFNEAWEMVGDKMEKVVGLPAIQTKATRVREQKKAKEELARTAPELTSLTMPGMPQQDSDLFTPGVVKQGAGLPPRLQHPFPLRGEALPEGYAEIMAEKVKDYLKEEFASKPAAQIADKPLKEVLDTEKVPAELTRILMPVMDTPVRDLFTWAGEQNLEPASWTDVLGGPLRDLLEAVQGRNFIKDQLEALGASLPDLVRQHYSVQNATQEQLVASILKANPNLKPYQAHLLAKAIRQKIRILTQKEREAVFKRILREKQKLNKPPKRTLPILQDFMGLANMGALERSAVVDKLLEKEGVKAKLTPADYAEMKKLSDAVREAPDGHPRDEALVAAKRFITDRLGTNGWEIASGLAYGNIFLKDTPHINNFMGNAYNALLENAVSMLTHPASAPLSIATQVKAILPGIHEAIAAMQGRTVSRTPGKIEYPRGFTAFSFKGPWSALNVPLRPFQFALNLMTGMDLPFYKPQEYSKLVVRAYDRARAKGLSLPDAYAKAWEDMWGTSDEQKAWRERAATEVKGAGLRAAVDRRRRVAEQRLARFSPEERLAAAQSAAEMTLNIENNEHSWSGHMAKTIRANLNRGEKSDHRSIRVGSFLARNALFRFTKIAANIIDLNLAMMGSPVVKAAFGSESWRAATPEQKLRWKVMATLGWSMMIAAYALNRRDKDKNWKDRNFWITGPGPKDAKTREALRDLGWRPYTMKIGGKWIQYQKITPLAVPLSLVGIVADIDEFNLMKDEATLWDNTVYAALGAANAFLNMSFLSSMYTLVDTVAASGKEGTEAALRWAEQQVATFVPYSVPAGRVGRILDPTVYDSNTMKALFWRDLGVVGLAGKPKLNVFGEAIKQQTPTLTEPLKGTSYTQYKSDPLLEFLAQHKSIPSKPAEGSAKKWDDGPPMKPDEFYAWFQQRGQTLRQELEKELASGRLQRIQAKQGDDGLRSEIEKISHAAGERAKKELF